jgi:hypothetical protein
MPCASISGGCDEPADAPCVAKYRQCDRVVGEPAPHTPVHAPESAASGK